MRQHKPEYARISWWSCSCK